MLDINLIRKNPELVKNNIKKKFQEEKLPLIEKILKKDESWRKQKAKVDSLRAERNKISNQINEAKKAKHRKEASELLKRAKKIPKEIEKMEEKTKKLHADIQKLLLEIPNIIHNSVPIGKNDKENKVIKKIGKPNRFDFKPKTHIEIAEFLGIVDFDASAKTSGNGFYYLIGDLALLNQALIKFGIDKMTSKGYTYIETPLMLKKEIINNVTDLNDQQNQVYKIENEDLYLIGTSEHSLIGRYIDKIINSKDLPIKNTSYSMCFRKEIGSHGINEKGLFRTHQFNKIEMIVICKPEESGKYFDELQKITVGIFNDLKIPIRILEICSGDLGDLKNKQVDIEAWSPVENAFYEIGSCSNLTDAQARKLKIRSILGNGEKFVPHTLNNTAIATSRAMRAILENYQQADGSIKIPDVLVPYMNGKKVIKKK